MHALFKKAVSDVKRINPSKAYFLHVDTYFIEHCSIVQLPAQPCSKKKHKQYSNCMNRGRDGIALPESSWISQKRKNLSPLIGELLRWQMPWFLLPSRARGRVGRRAPRRPGIRARAGRRVGRRAREWPRRTRPRRTRGRRWARGGPKPTFFHAVAKVSFLIQGLSPDYGQ
jgi:hypothetical protein